MSDRLGRRLLLGNPRVFVREAPARNPQHIVGSYPYRLEGERPMRITDEASQVIERVQQQRAGTGEQLVVRWNDSLGSLELTVPATDAPGASAARDLTLRELKHFVDEERARAQRGEGTADYYAEVHRQLVPAATRFARLERPLMGLVELVEERMERQRRREHPNSDIDVLVRRLDEEDARQEFYEARQKERHVSGRGQEPGKELK